MKLSLQHEETSEIEKNFVGAKKLDYLLKEGVYAVKNIGIEILMYIQIFALFKGASFLEGIQQS